MERKIRLEEYQLTKTEMDIARFLLTYLSAADEEKRKGAIDRIAVGSVDSNALYAFCCEKGASLISELNLLAKVYEGSRLGWSVRKTLSAWGAVDFAVIKDGVSPEFDRLLQDIKNYL